MSALNLSPRSLCRVAPTTATDAPFTTVRIATWNIETVGAPGSAEYEAALDVLERVDADLIALNEVASSSDSANLALLAADAGYSSVVVPASNPVIGLFFHEP